MPLLLGYKIKYFDLVKVGDLLSMLSWENTEQKMHVGT